jgi:cephalosporin hydroxylase
VITVIIPAREEIYLQQTIDNVLANAKGEIEIIAICDGYWPNPPIKDDPRVRLIHNTEPRGQRHSINDAAKLAQGDYVMKLDAHCAVGEGFDTILIRDYEPDQTVVPTMYNLDIETFTPKVHKRTDYMYIGWKEGHLRSLYYPGSGQKQPRNDKMIDDIMTCMGPGFFMSKERFWALGGCDETHGHWGQQGVEVAMKAWMSGGRLVVNKNTWFSHWFRGHYEHPSGRKGFPYSIRQSMINKARAYSTDLWMNNKWEGQVEGRNMQWLVDKFNPPGWDDVNARYPTEESRHKLFPPFYQHIHRRKNDSLWRGLSILKFPNDLLLYAQVIHEKKPQVIVEIGTKFGGSALFFQDMLDIAGIEGQVITIDIKDQVAKKDPRINYLLGSSLDEGIVNKIHELTAGKQTMLVIDGNHGRVHVKNELHRYRDIVSVGQFMVVEDCYIDRGLYGPGMARNWFLDRYKGFVKRDLDKRYLIGISMGGWLEKTA